MSSLLSRARYFNTKKSLGQNFLVSEEALDNIYKAINPQANENILEIGPGIGFLTERLIEAKPNLAVIDLDAKALEQITCKQKIKTINGDALHYDFNELEKPLKVVGNLPFNVGTQILLRFIGELDSPIWAIEGINEMVLMFQLEVAERLCAKPSSKAYNPLSLAVQSKSNIEFLFKVPARCFQPIPKVDAGVVRITPNPNSPLKELNETELKNLKLVIKTAFSQRRKNLKNSLKTLFNPDELTALNISSLLRPENLSLNDFLTLARGL